MVLVVTKMESEPDVDGRPAQYGLTLTELRELMEVRGAEALERIQSQYGSVFEMCKKLYTSPNEGQFCILI